MCVNNPLLNANLALASAFGTALAPWVGEQVSVYLANLAAEALEGLPMPVHGENPCPAYPPAPTPTPTTGGGGSITGGTPIQPGVPGPTGNVGPIMGSNNGATLMWLCPPPAEDMRTGVVMGTLAFVGMDYIIIRIPIMGACIDLIIPIFAIGMVVGPCPLL